jgi:hypothetical protein
MKVRVLGEILERARPLTIFCSSQPLPLPKARVQVIASDQFISVRDKLDVSTDLSLIERRLFRWLGWGGAGEGEGMAEGEGVGGVGVAGFFEDGEEVAAEG